MCNFFLESKDLPPIACYLYGKPGPDGGGKSMIVGVPRETYPGERRVALVPAVVPNLKKAGLEVVVETGAGLEAGYRTRTTPQRARRLPRNAPKYSAPPTFSCRYFATAQTTRRAKPTLRCSAAARF